MLKDYIRKISEHQDLTTKEMKDAMNIIMDGKASGEQVSACLIARKMKKESPAEIAAASSVMVSKAAPLPTTACKHHATATGGCLSFGTRRYHLPVCPDLS